MIDVTRDPTPPTSLAAKPKEWGDDVIAALHRDFLRKCYLCETWVEQGTFTVDHRRPKTLFQELEHAWTNLFPACTLFNCNGRRLKATYPSGGLLDPAADENVETRVYQQLENPSALLDSNAAKITFKPAQSDDIAAVNTAIELDRIHNGTGSSKGGQRAARALRGHINKWAVAIGDHLRQLDTLPANAPERAAHAQALRRLLARDAPYYMLMRSYFGPLPQVQALLDGPTP